jgi:hypothetical protein
MLEQARPSANLRSPKLNFDFTAVRKNGFSTGYRRLPVPVTCSTRAGVTCHPYISRQRRLLRYPPVTTIFTRKTRSKTLRPMPLCSTAVGLRKRCFPLRLTLRDTVLTLNSVTANL